MVDGTSTGQRLGWLALFVCCLAGAGCGATFAPPVRFTQYGAPGRLEEGQMEVGGTAGTVGMPGAGGGPHIGIAIRDWFALEAGGNFSGLSNEANWAMGWFGPRFSLVPYRHDAVHFIGDLELGGGLGLGGILYGNGATGSLVCSDCDGLTWSQRTAYGSYQGIGIGVRIHWCSLYLRTRIEETISTNIPLTLWPSFGGFFEAAAGPRVAVNFGGGIMARANPVETTSFAFFQVGLTVFFDAWEKKEE